MSDRTAARLAWAVFGLAGLLLLGGVVGALLAARAWGQPMGAVVPDTLLTAATFSFAVVGVVIAGRQPRNAVGWILLGVGLVWQLDYATARYVEWGFAHPGSLPRPDLMFVVTSWLWIPALVPLGTLLLLLFPDGRLPSPRWRWLAWLSGVAMVVPSLLILVFPGPLDPSSVGIDVPPEAVSGMTNPLGVEALAPVANGIYVLVLLIPLCMVGCATALVQRFRRSRGVQRLQLKWLAATAALVAAVYLVTMLASLPYDWSFGETTPTWLRALQTAALATFMLIPLAVGVAVLKHRLYDIDRLINRALVYGPVSGLLAAVYVLGVVGAQGLLRAATGQAQNNLAVAASTLAVAALFRPLRARVQRFIDRRFYRSRYDAARTIEAFATRLRQETDIAALSRHLRQVAAETVQPTRVALWIAPRHAGR